MTDTTKTPRDPVTPINVEEPIWLAIDQTEHKTYVETFAGWEAEHKAKAYASKKAAKTGRVVVLFGPQVAVARPPEPVTVGLVEAVTLARPGDAV